MMDGISPALGVGRGQEGVLLITQAQQELAALELAALKGGKFFAS